jgi:uncharacterized membrane protein YbhN (UPF0104 family)
MMPATRSTTIADMVISPSLATLNGGSMDNVLLFAAGELFIVIVMMALIARLNGKDQDSRHLYFGSVVLTALALVFMLAMAMYYWADAGSADRAQKLFEACQQIIPPLLTLVIGFYFGQKR